RWSRSTACGVPLLARGAAMTATWPAGVPTTPLAGTYQASPFRAPLTTDMEDGPRRARRATTKSIATVSFTIRMSNDAFATFQACVRDDLVDGTLPFTMPIWTGGAFATKTCAFRAPYADDPGHGLRHRV